MTYEERERWLDRQLEFAEKNKCLSISIGRIYDIYDRLILNTANPCEMFPDTMLLPYTNTPEYASEIEDRNDMIRYKMGKPNAVSCSKLAMMQERETYMETLVKFYGWTTKEVNELSLYEAKRLVNIYFNNHINDALTIEETKRQARLVWSSYGPLTKYLWKLLDYDGIKVSEALNHAYYKFTRATLFENPGKLVYKFSKSYLWHDHGIDHNFFNEIMLPMFAFVESLIKLPGNNSSKLYISDLLFSKNYAASLKKLYYELLDQMYDDMTYSIGETISEVTLVIGTKDTLICRNLKVDVLNHCKYADFFRQFAEHSRKSK